MKRRLKNILIISVLAALFSANSVFAVSYYDVGKNYYNKKDYNNANKQFKNALSQNPYNVNYRYYYAQTLVYLEKLDEAQKEYEKIIELSPLSDAAKLASYAIIKIQKSLNDVEEDDTYYESDQSNGKPTIDGIGENYIDNALDNGKVVRWDLGKMPLKIYFNDSEKISGFQKYYVTSVKSALDDWISNLSGLMYYAVVDNPKDANIIVKFTSSISTQKTKDGGISFISGLTSHKIKSNLLNSVEIDFLTVKPDKKPFSETEIYNTGLHEIGHALGIIGHSYNTDDIMYPEAKRIVAKEKLSSRDMNTIKLLYKLDADVSNFDPNAVPNKGVDKNSLVLGDTDARLDKKLQEAKDYVGKIPEQPLGWSNLGDVYYSKKQYFEAVENYKKALAIDAKYNLARERLAATYAAMGDVYNSVSEYRTLITSEPGNKNNYINLAIVYRNNNNYQEAYNVIKSLVSKNPAAQNEQIVKQLLLELNKR